MTKHLTDAVSAMLELDTEKMSEYVTLTLEKRLVAAETTKRNARLKELEQDMLDQFEEAELVDGIIISGYNLKPSSIIWASALEGNYDRSCQALEDSGHGEYVQARFDSKKVSKLIREYAESEEGIPEELEEGLNIVEKFSISMTKAKSPKGKKK